MDSQYIYKINHRATQKYSDFAEEGAIAVHIQSHVES